MPSLAHLFASLVVSPAEAAAPGPSHNVQLSLDEVFGVSKVTVQRVVLTSGSLLALTVPGNVHALWIAVVSGAPVTLGVDSGGGRQTVPVDPFLTLVSKSTAITAVDLTRTAATETTVDVFMGTVE